MTPCQISPAATACMELGGPMRRAKGMTMLELLIAMFIVSLLAMIAIPAYQDYSVRAKVSEGLTLISPAKSIITEMRLSTGAWPTNNTTAGLPDPTDFATNWVESIAVSDVPTPGAVVITFKPSILPGNSANNTIIFSPNFDGTKVSWDCSGGTLARDFRPANCR